MLLHHALFASSYLVISIYGTEAHSFHTIHDVTPKAHLTDVEEPLLAVDLQISPHSSSTLLACIRAPNCETYLTSQGTMIRFKPGEEPGSANYQRRFGSNLTQPTIPSFPVADTLRPIITFDSSTNTNIDLFDQHLVYGSTSPYDALHNIWDHCDIGSCDDRSFSVDTSSVRSVGNGNTMPVGYTLTLSVTGQYNGWDQRAAFITAVLTAIQQNSVAAKENWVVRTRDDVQTGTLTVYTQTGFISVNRFSGNNLQGFMSVKISQAAAPQSGWCAVLGAELGGVAGCVGSIGGGFFGQVNVGCSTLAH